MALTSNLPDFKELSQKAVAANKDHQYALKVYTERLESELQTVDKLLVRLLELVTVLGLTYIL
jgi:hypothetical protein